MEQMEIEAEEVKLTSQQQKALSCWVQAKLLPKLCSLDLNRTTIWRWTKTPEFQLIEYIDCEARVEVQQV